jgi:hypothetical protein
MYKSNINITTFLLFFLLLFPKITLIPINNYWQGLRIENLISLMILFYFFFNNVNFMFYFNQKKKINLYIIYYFLLINFSYIIGTFNNFSLEYFSYFRLIEYFFFIFFINHIKLNILSIKPILLSFFLFNLIFCILQNNNLIGYWSSMGYIGVETIQGRSSGLLGGPWELSFISSLFFLFILSNKIFSKITKCIFFFIMIYILYSTRTRGVIFPLIFTIVLLGLLIEGNQKLKIITIFLFLTLLLIIISIFYLSANEYRYDYYYLDPTILFEIFYNTFFLDYKIRLDEYSNNYWSYIYRIYHWHDLYQLYQKNLLTIFFGTGFTHVYYESFIIRVLFGTGIIGLIIFIYIIIKSRLPIYYIFFLTTASISLDLFASFKIFLSFIIFLKFINTIDEKKNTSN